jgi:lipopolysaccharide/colanic/teichoic acid biosynthesis glycosyltransferase
MDEVIMSAEFGQAYAYSHRQIIAGYHDSLGYLIAKRFWDLVAASLALIILFPLLLVIAAAIYIDDPHGSPIFVQERVGKGGKRFYFFKFRSMVMDAEKRLQGLLHQNEMDGPAFKIKNDPRLTKLGRIIRRASLDELPQLINIIKGEMSVVGPRPPLPREVAQYGEYEMQRLLVKPGLTCYWQARGRCEIGFQEWMEMDMKYVFHHNLWVDLKLVLLTVRAVVTGRGAM